MDPRQAAHPVAADSDAVRYLYRHGHHPLLSKPLSACGLLVSFMPMPTDTAGTRNLYTMSSIYHGLNPKRKAKKVFQVLDHCSIYLLIAGSYTPFALCTLREYNTALGWTIFGVIWFVAILGIILNSIDIKKFRVFSMICYLVMGWCIVFKINLLPELLGTAGFVLLLLGGLSYTVGAILYGLGKKHKYMHSVFHLFILLGSLLQFFTILLYVM